jgi:hypothetical protein
VLAPAFSVSGCRSSHSCEFEGSQLFLIEVLGSLLKSSERTVATFLRVAACILSVAMLLSFPAARPHHFGQHFGTTEIRQNIVRHTFVAEPEPGEEEIAQSDAQPAIPMPVTLESVAKSFLSPAIVSNLPTFRILQHLKLGPSRSGASDPLL